MKHTLNKYWETLKYAGSEFMNDKALKMSASLSYYTIFSLAPMLIIIISVCSIFFGKDAVQGQVFYQIRSMVGNNAASQIQEILKNSELSNQSGVALIVGIGTLLIGATGVFGEIQDSINAIWSLKVKPRKGWLKLIINRLLSFSMIISIGFLLLVSLMVNTLLDIFNARLQSFFPDVMVSLFYVLNMLLVFLVITCLFTLIFKVLPDGRLRWKDAIIGAGFTAVLFMIGKLLITLYLSQTQVVSAYGSAGSIVLVLLWVNYSSAILFFGAEFTKAYTIFFGQKIIPNEDTVIVVQREIQPLTD